MSNKQFTILFIMLLIVIGLLIYIANQNHQLADHFSNVSNYLSDKIDVLTGKVNELR